MSKEKKGVRLEHISKIYQDPKTGKDFYAVRDASGTLRLREDHHLAYGGGLREPGRG